MNRTILFHAPYLLRHGSAPADRSIQRSLRSARRRNSCRASRLRDSSGRSPRSRTRTRSAVRPDRRRRRSGRCGFHDRPPQPARSRSRDGRPLHRNTSSRPSAAIRRRRCRPPYGYPMREHVRSNAAGRPAEPPAPRRDRCIYETRSAALRSARHRRRSGRGKPGNNPERPIRAHGCRANSSLREAACP